MMAKDVVSWSDLALVASYRPCWWDSALASGTDATTMVRVMACRSAPVRSQKAHSAASFPRNLAQAHRVLWFPDGLAHGPEAHRTR